MANYTLTVKLDSSWVKQWANDPDMRLCFASSVSSGPKPYRNVVAFTTDIAPGTDISWTEKYKIGAANTSFNAGATFVTSSEIIPVEFGTKTTLEKDWDIKANKDTSAPDKGFLFTNKKIAAAVLYKEVNGTFSPIYISHSGKLPLDSKETLIPQVTVHVWYSSETTSSTMIDSIQSQVAQVTMDRPNKTVMFDKDGNWQNL